MKKKFLFTTIAAAALATAALGIAACDDPAPEEQPEGPSPYTVTFDANGGAFASTVNTPVVLEVNAENKLAAFPTSNPTHASSATHDYAFAGWTVTKDTLPLLDLNKVYDKSTTVYAYWNTTPKQGGGGGGGGGGVESTYTVTFHGNGGLWGTDTEQALTTNTSGLLASLPATPEHPEDKTFKGYTIGTTDTGNYIDVTTPYTANTDVYAQWGDNTPMVAGDYNLYVNDVLVNNALLEGTDGADTRPANLFFNYYAEGVTLHEGDTVKFVLKDITISKIWAKGGTAIQGVTGFQDSQGKIITGDTVTVLADGIYTVSVSQYNEQKTDHEVSVYIGPYTGIYESGGGGSDISGKTGLYANDTKISATVQINPSNENELMITGVSIDTQTTLVIYYNDAAMDIDISVSGTTDSSAVTITATNVTLKPGNYDLYYTLSTASANAKKLWVTKIEDAPDTDKNTALTYKSPIDADGHFVVGKFHSRGMNSFVFNDGYVMSQNGSGVWELKNIYLYEGDSFKVRLGKNDGSGYNIWEQTDQLSWDGGNANVKAGGEGYYTVQLQPATGQGGESTFKMVVTFHGANPAA